MVDNPKNLWVDTSKEMLSEYAIIFGKKFYMRNSSTLEVVGIGKVVLKMTLGMEVTLVDVHHVSDIRNNHVSCSLLSSMDLDYCLSLISLY